MNPLYIIHNLKRPILKMSLISTFLFSFIITSLAQSSELINEIKPLKIGESIPDELWKLPLNVVNEPSGKKQNILEQYKGKLILLDFWGTYCSSCIGAFPKLKKVQDDNVEKLKILAVSPESKDKIHKFFNSEFGHKYGYIHSVYEDKILKKYFPHFGVPFVVWITPEGKFFISTNTYEITQENISRALNNDKRKILTKVAMDSKKPLMLSDNFYLNNNLKLGFYSIFFQGYYPGYASGGKLKSTAAGKNYGRQFKNKKLNAIVRALAMHLFEENHEQFSDKRLIVKTTNPNLIDPIQSFVEKLPDDQYYSYEFIVPEEKADSLYTYMLADLNRYFDFRLSLRKKKTDCLVLVRTSSIDKIKSKSDRSGRNFLENQGKLTMADEPIGNLISLLNEIPLSKLPIIDETDYKSNIDLRISGMNSLDQLRKSLAQFDLDLKPATRDLLMFAIEDKK